MRIDFGKTGFSAREFSGAHRQNGFRAAYGFLPLHTFRRCVARYPSSHSAKTFSHLDQYLCIAFAQLTLRESLRDFKVCLRAQNNTVTALDTTTIDLSLKVFPWAHFRKAKAAVKMPTQIDQRRRVKRPLRIHFESMDQRPPSPAANNLRRSTSGTAR